MLRKQIFQLLGYTVLLCAGIQIHAGLTLFVALLFCLLKTKLWSGNLRSFLYLTLGVGMPLFPDLGLEIAGRILNWFDLLFIIFGVWSLLHFFSNKQRYRLDRVSFGAIFFLLILLMLVWRSSIFAVSFREWISYAVNFFLTYWVIQNLDLKNLQAFIISVLSASIFVSLVALWQNLNGFRYPTLADGEVSIRLGVPGTFEDSLVLSMYAGFMVILGLMGFMRFRAHLKYFCLLGIVMNLLSIKLALSRNGIFILGVSLIIFMLIRFGDWLKYWRNAIRIPLILLSTPLCCVMLLIVMPTDIYHRITSAFYLFSGSNDPVIMYNIRSTLGRLENYKTSLQIFWENPWEGIGLGLYPILTKFDDTDGFYTGLLAETGFIGMAGFLVFALAFISLVLVCIRRLKSLNQTIEMSKIVIFYEMYAALILALFLVSFFEPVFKVQIMTFYIFYFLRLLTFESGEHEMGGDRFGT